MRRRAYFFLLTGTFFSILKRMSDEKPPYSQIYIQAWTLISIVAAVILFGMFLIGDTLLGAGHVVWDLIRWLASPII